MLLLDNFEKSMFEKDYKTAMDIIDKIVSDKYFESIPILLNHLENTDNSAIRNSISIALSDIGFQGVVKPLINLIKDPKTKGDRGTLLYALEELDYSDHLDDIFLLIFDDCFEVSRQSYLLIQVYLKKENTNLTLTKKQNKLLIRKIHNLQDDIAFYLSALELLSK